MSSSRTFLFSLLALLLLLGGCRQDMHDQAKLEPYESSSFFEDGRSARLPVEGTVARGNLVLDDAFHTGFDEAGNLLTELPMPLRAQKGMGEILRRGHERYGIFCAPCHSAAGDGNGMIVRRGFKQPESFQSPRLLASEVGYFFDVMTNGFGQMSSYATQVPVEDRWAIAAYLRALQFSQSARLAELPAMDRQAVISGKSPYDDHKDSPANGHSEEGH